MSVTSSPSSGPVDPDAVAALVTRAAAVDGAAALGEPSLLALRHDPGSVVVRAVDSPDGPVGVLVGRTEGDALDVEVVVDPARRRTGVGRALLGSLPDDVGPLLGWAHGDLPAARAFAAAAGFRAVRTLHRRRRPLTEPLPAYDVPDGYAIRPFRAGGTGDDAEWVRVNAAAFAHHPEQGAMTIEDLRERQGEDWFDAAGFLVADGPDGRMAGFHWTKVHPAGTARPDRATGEVYVVGVDPSAQGTGLGRALTLAGLHHLRERGLDTVMLYVDADNAPAVRLYERLGFTPWSDDVQWRRD